jgi:hypothetical protein
MEMPPLGRIYHALAHHTTRLRSNKMAHHRSVVSTVTKHGMKAWATLIWRCRLGKYRPVDAAVPEPRRPVGSPASLWETKYFSLFPQPGFYRRFTQYHKNIWELGTCFGSAEKQHARMPAREQWSDERADMRARFSY